MEMKVFWTRYAEEKLKDIFIYYSDRVSLRIAQKLTKEIIDKSFEIQKHPFTGQKEILLAGRVQDFRYLVYKNYKIIYWVNVNKKRIEIVNIFDCRQNPQKLNDF
jgi:toxin ParE1/3/4